MTFSTKNSGESFFSRYDSRNDLGYGVTKNKFHKPRSLSGEFPYTTSPGPHDISGDEEIDLEDEKEAIDKKVISYSAIDFGASKKANPFYFAAGNTKLSDCFFRTEKVLEAVGSFSNSLSPMPYKNKKGRSASLGHSTRAGAITGQNYRRTGSRKGFASAPPELKYSKIVNDEDERIFNLQDLEKKLDHESGNFNHFG